jgi:ABC-type sugar transport system permease subunit
MKPDRQNLLGYALLLPAALIMMLCGVLPMAFVAYYSLHDTFGGNSFIWVGADWFK